MLGEKNGRETQPVAYPSLPPNADIERLAKRGRTHRWAIKHPVGWGVLWGVYFALLQGFLAWTAFPNHVWRTFVLIGVVGGAITGAVGWFGWHVRRARELKLS